MRTFTQWADLFYDAGDEIGRTFRVCDGILEESAEKAGFEKIVHKQYTIPLAGWPKDPRLKKQGHFVGLYMDMSVDGFAVYPIGQILGWSFEEVQVLVAQMRAILRNPKHLGTGDMWVSRQEIAKGSADLISPRHTVYGQKPPNPTTEQPPAPEGEAA
ncbi:hypothetical protein NW767_015750 [Fusarium falciforme]|nr:hypothetical protein NW767_015750 [Fusarium falciforme]